MIDEPYLFVRAASLYLTVALTALVWVWRRPSPRALAGAMLGFCWNLPVILGLHVVAELAGWWHFDAQGGLLLGMPVEAWLSWAWLWGAVPALAFPSTPLAAVALMALLIDLVVMPAAEPLVRLGPLWVAGDLIGIFFWPRSQPDPGAMDLTPRTAGVPRGTADRRVHGTGPLHSPGERD